MEPRAFARLSWVDQWSMVEQLTLDGHLEDPREEQGGANGESAQNGGIPLPARTGDANDLSSEQIALAGFSSRR